MAYSLMVPFLLATERERLTSYLSCRLVTRGDFGDEVADPPADVPALSDSAGESAEKALTIKDLLAAHRQRKVAMIVIHGWILGYSF